MPAAAATDAAALAAAAAEDVRPPTRKRDRDPESLWGGKRARAMAAEDDRAESKEEKREVVEEEKRGSVLAASAASAVAAAAEDDADGVSPIAAAATGLKTDSSMWLVPAPPLAPYRVLKDHYRGPDLRTRIEHSWYAQLTKRDVLAGPLQLLSEKLKEIKAADDEYEWVIIPILKHARRVLRSATPLPAETVARIQSSYAAMIEQQKKLPHDPDYPDRAHHPYGQITSRPSWQWLRGFVRSSLCYDMARAALKAWGPNPVYMSLHAAGLQVLQERAFMEIVLMASPESLGEAVSWSRNLDLGIAILHPPPGSDTDESGSMISRLHQMMGVRRRVLLSMRSNEHGRLPEDINGKIQEARCLAWFHDEITRRGTYPASRLSRLAAVDLASLTFDSDTDDAMGKLLQRVPAVLAPIFGAGEEAAEWKRHAEDTALWYASANRSERVNFAGPYLKWEAMFKYPALPPPIPRITDPIHRGNSTNLVLRGILHKYNVWTVETQYAADLAGAVRPPFELATPQVVSALRERNELAVASFNTTKAIFRYLDDKCPLLFLGKQVEFDRLVR